LSRVQAQRAKSKFSVCHLSSVNVVNIVNIVNVVAWNVKVMNFE
jgi:hypothetical protein